ncbi:LacI family DNA-binding transcriptional regulator [Microbacterium sp. No. 7]|uniref:LacI family DNA-binding transcriptional regulator n=1 Tax=Microbacterium sp. No. 7 TaxID=1714373 RepID=UPI0006D20820|nr:substrate-binding domain-containing protein [Microbacterium sp. No. 7]ALJ18494.1 transcriptional regulator [Microbacterium sp. No. 7]
MTTRRVTIADVARAAGVSASTASVAFSGKAPISPETSRRVRDAAAALGYAGPDPRAASLRRGRSGIVGVVFPQHLAHAFRDPVNILMMDGLADAVAPLGAGLLLLRADAGADGPTLLTAPIDAAVLLACDDAMREQVAVLRSRGVPVVAIESNAGDDTAVITLNNREAQGEAARHVRDLGHERVAVVGLPRGGGAGPGWLADADEISVEVTRARLQGVRDVYPDAPAYLTRATSIDEGLAAGRVLLGDPATRPTAVIAQSDLLAAGVIRAAEEAGLRVPDDLSVTGFDGVRVDGLTPYELTTLVQDAGAKGRAAGDAVASMLAGGEPDAVALECAFRLGNTTAPPWR